MGKTTETTNTNTQARKKITAEIIKMADLAAGETVKGIYLDQSERPWFDQKTGNDTVIPVFHFENTEGVRFNVFGDAGLKNAMSGANVQKGMNIEIEKKAKVDIGGGRMVNNYDIYQLQ